MGAGNAMSAQGLRPFDDHLQRIPKANMENPFDQHHLLQVGLLNGVGLMTGC